MKSAWLVKHVARALFGSRDGQQNRLGLYGVVRVLYIARESITLDVCMSIIKCGNESGSKRRRRKVDPKRGAVHAGAECRESAGRRMGRERRRSRGLQQRCELISSLIVGLSELGRLRLRGRGHTAGLDLKILSRLQQLVHGDPHHPSRSEGQTTERLSDVFARRVVLAQLLAAECSHLGRRVALGHHAQEVRVGVEQGWVEELRGFR